MTTDIKNVHCPICKKEISHQLLFKTNSIRSDEIFDIGQCTHCELVRVLNIPENLEKYYEGEVMKKKLNCVHASMKRFLLRRELRRILESCDPKSVFLDLGCGVGDFTNLMYENGLKVAAIDSDEKRPVDIETNTNIPYYTFDYSRNCINGFKNVDNGTVILRHVLEHTTDPVKFINSLISYGVRSFYIVVPNHCCLEAKLFGQYYYFLDPPLHLSFFNELTLGNLLKCCRLETVNSGFDTIPNVISSIYRYLSMKNFPRGFCELLKPQSVINSLSAPLNLLLPNNVIWLLAKLK